MDADPPNGGAETAAATSERAVHAPYTDLTPGGVLDALDAVGLRGDGRLIQLNSYENRVFQGFLDAGAVYRFGVTERLAGRAPELEDADVRRWLGRYIGRLHAIGATSTFAHRL